MVKNGGDRRCGRRGPSQQRLRAPAAATGRRGRRWRRRRTRWRGEAVAVAARFTAAGPWRCSNAVGNEGERGGSEGRGRGGERGEWERGPRRRGRWRPYPLLDAGEGVRRGRAPVPTLVGGTGKGRERPREAAGPAGWARWAGLAASWVVWSRGSFSLLSSAFVFSFLFLFCFI